MTWLVFVCVDGERGSGVQLGTEWPRSPALTNMAAGPQVLEFLSQAKR